VSATAAAIEPLVSATRIAELLGVSDRWVRWQAAAGELPAVRLGTRWRFRESEVLAWVEDRRTAGLRSVDDD
jgi:excisionase family DNA binding protein